ncbi:hypothetical protein [Candidatus Igneacidithiobacillus taiwanensis]|uniref:hypothetical protein n=1 Tax=Candidatus Igneacidithiobacillus taiwanensis TaxID=1945924 RepID=UPI00289CC5E6|nr:hypothetical protein [Candidatus Igneacidithiobacillus taiwanensis]
MATNRLMQRNNLADAFIPVGDDATNKALAEARTQVGDAEWKKGFSPETKKIVRDTLKAHGVRYEERLQGKLLDVQTAETQANGETFHKLRVTLEHDGGKTTLSADMDSEFAQRLVTKLDTASREHAGEEVTIGAFAYLADRNGREFVNHAATMKDAAGQEIPAAPGHFQAAQEKARAAQEPLKTAGIADKKVLNSIAETTREAYFKGLADDLHSRFVERGIAPKKAEREQYPALEAGVKDPEGNWHNLSLHEKEGRLVGTLQRREADGYQKVPLVFEKTEKGLEATASLEDGTPLSVVLSKSEPTPSGLEKVNVIVSQNGTPIHEHPGRLRENAALQKIPEHREGKAIREALGVDPQMLKPYAPGQTQSRAPAKAVEKAQGQSL